MLPFAASTADLAGLADRLRALAPADDDADRIERIRQFEELKAVLEAVQVETAVAFAASQQAEQAAAGVPPSRRDRGVAAQLALAMRVSPFRAARWLGWARIATTELPATFALLRSGRTSAWRTQLVARETAVVSREQRAAIDAAVAADLPDWGDRRTETETRRLAEQADPAACVARRRRAESERRVTIRPAPDTMAYVTLLAPCAAAVAVYAALTRAADATTAVGDTRARGQIMADTAVERLTGQAHADAVPVEIALIMPAETLLGSERFGPEHPVADEAAADPVAGARHVEGTTELVGFGPVPAELARRLALDDNHDARRWIRRLFRAPNSARLMQMETHRREFTDAQRRFVRLRDRTCRTPYCDAPIRHIDHVRRAEHGGPTSITNAAGLCEACNYANQAPEWVQSVDGHGTVTTETPTGHRYRSPEPRPPSTAAPPDDRDELRRVQERRLDALLVRSTSLSAGSRRSAA